MTSIPADAAFEVDCVLLLERLGKSVPDDAFGVFTTMLEHTRAVLSQDSGQNFAITSALRSIESRLEAAVSRATLLEVA